MTVDDEQLARLRAFNAEVRERDGALDLETVKRRRATESFEGPPGVVTLAQESIILRRNRPVLAIQRNSAQLAFQDEEESTIWKERLEKAGELTDRAILSVGRIELATADDWIGTGWLVADDVLATNRHVAEAFSTSSGGDFVFTMGPRVAIDFLQEVASSEKLVFRITRTIYIEPEGGPDLAFLQIEHASGSRAARPIALGAPAKTLSAAVIGYPAWDSRVRDADLMRRTFQNVYDKKRLAPGAVTGIDATQILHDCSTLGGNSGSVVLSLDSGEALGLHFQGKFLVTNYGVRADLVKERLASVRAGLARARSAPIIGSSTRTPSAETHVATGVVHLTVPLHITVSLGTPGAAPAVGPAAGTDPARTDATTRTADAAHRAPGAPPRRKLRMPKAPEEKEAANEAKVTAADYADREGYVPAFLGDDFEIPFPTLVKKRTDVVTFDPGDGSKQAELHYRNFSVVMSKSRRMCRYSACNIDGKTSKKTARPDWRFDPRIPQSAQIRYECYGSPPKFSRGHMTRREDPAWGTQAEAEIGCADSMHVTNAVPQMQAFNSPVWLELEDYALQNARKDKQRITVITGPYLLASDPVIYEVKVPVRFWKIIAFIHDETGELCATGYEMGQEDNLPSEDEFVFGNLVSSYTNLATQVSIASIESKSGLGFSDLSDFDPFVDEEESVDGSPVPLLSLTQIKFR